MLLLMKSDDPKDNVSIENSDFSYEIIQILFTMFKCNWPQYYKLQFTKANRK